MEYPSTITWGTPDPLAEPSLRSGLPTFLPVHTGNSFSKTHTHTQGQTQIGVINNAGVVCVINRRCLPVSPSDATREKCLCGRYLRQLKKSGAKRALPVCMYVCPYFGPLYRHVCMPVFWGLCLKSARRIPVAIFSQVQTATNHTHTSGHTSSLPACLVMHR